MSKSDLNLEFYTMLIEFSVSNFRSFSEQQTLSMVASSLKENCDMQVFTPSQSPSLSKLSLLKEAVIYGANASGKTNVVLAMLSMKRIVKGSAKYQRGDALPVTAFKLDERLLKSPSEFEVIFISDGVRYQYGFSATSEKIHDEWLYAYPKNRAQLWFSRVWNKDENTHEWKFGTAFSGNKKVWLEATRENALFLSTAVQLNNEQLRPVFDWFKERLHFIGTGGLSVEYTADFCKKEGSQEVLRFLKQADLGIENIRIEEEKFDPSSLPLDMPEALRGMFIDEIGDKPILEVKTQHKGKDDKLVEFSLSEESEGTKKLFSFAAPWIEVLEKGAILFVDELNDNLHPNLVKFLIELFHNPRTNPNNAQLIFTTHETSVLSQSIFRRDQIWFCEKSQYGESELYPLTDFHPRKGRENLEVSYLGGRYGAIPYPDFLEDGNSYGN